LESLGQPQYAAAAAAAVSLLGAASPTTCDVEVGLPFDTEDTWRTSTSRYCPRTPWIPLLLLEVLCLSLRRRTQLDGLLLVPSTNHRIRGFLAVISSKWRDE